MEERILKIMFSKSGNGGRVNRLTVPTTWVDKMNLTKEDREVLVSFDEEEQTITIKKIKK